MAAMMKEYDWRVPEAQRANLIMVEENMAALENGVQASAGEKEGAGRDGGRGTHSPCMPIEQTLASMGNIYSVHSRGKRSTLFRPTRGGRGGGAGSGGRGAGGVGAAAPWE